MGERTGDRLMGASRRLRRRLFEAMAEVGVTPAQGRALRLVTELEPVRLTALAERLHIAPRSTTEVVDALEAAGLVVRVPDPRDRRATCVEVTPAGRVRASELEEIRDAVTEEFLTPLSPSQRQALDGLLTMLVED